ncbi:MAG: Cna B-type domain-containing protein [Bulleidia sp.]
MKIAEKLRIILTAFIAGMLMLALPLRISAEEIEQHDDCSITLKPADGLDIEGAVFRAYRFADVSGNGEVTLASEYYRSGADISLYDGNEEHMASLARTLTGYIGANSLSFQKAAIHDRELTFSGLKQGVYLILGEPYSTEKGTFKASAMILSVPNREEGKAWNYHVSGEIKGEFIPKTDTTTEIKVSKLWAGDGEGTARPVSIQVQLVHDGTSYGDPVTLDASNNWSYTWKDVPDEGSWDVSELNVPAGYTASVSASGKEFRITNTYHNETPAPSPTPTPAATPTPTTPSVTPTPTPAVPAATPTPTPNTPTAPPTQNTPTPTPFTPETRTPFTPMTSARRPYTPYTSDDWNMGLWISLLAGAGAVLIYAGTRLRNDQ